MSTHGLLGEHASKELAASWENDLVGPKVNWVCLIVVCGERAIEELAEFLWMFHFLNPIWGKTSLECPSCLGINWMNYQLVKIDVCFLWINESGNVVDRYVLVTKTAEWFRWLAWFSGRSFVQNLYYRIFTTDLQVHWGLLRRISLGGS